MSDLSAMLKKGRKPVEVVKRVDRFDVKKGSIPLMVPVLRKDQRTFAGGRVVLKEKLDALRSKDDERIKGWGDYYDLADACLTFEDLVKLQLDSPLLTGIRGVVKTDDGLYVAVDAEAVNAATNGNMQYFNVSELETVTYDLEGRQSETAQNVVLLQYNPPHNIQLTADQFRAVKANPINRNDILHNRDMSMDEIIKDGKVIHPAWGIYPARIMVPLVENAFKYSKRVYAHNEIMGFYLPQPNDNAEMRALCASRLDGRSGLCGYDYLGYDDCRLVGVVNKAAAGGKPKK